eukprot:Colp12_sorted_trinity150504_noHs@25736
MALGTVHVKGFAHLCFVEEGWFQGHLIEPLTQRQYGIVGEVTEPPPGTVREACFGSEPPTYYNITIFDFKNNKEAVFKYAEKTNGDNAKLWHSANLDFYTQRLLSGPKADEYAEKHFKKLAGRPELLICIGEMEVDLLLI